MPSSYVSVDVAGCDDDDENILLRNVGGIVLYALVLQGIVF